MQAVPTLLQQACQARLELECQPRHFIDEQRPFRCQSESRSTTLGRLWPAAEELVLDPGLGPGAVDAHEGTLGTFRAQVDRERGTRLADAALAGDQDGGVGRAGDALNCLSQALTGMGVADRELVGGRRLVGP